MATSPITSGGNLDPNFTTAVTPANSFDPAVQVELSAAAVGKNKTSADMTADDFLKLLTVQLQNQDPLKPMEDTAFMAQMAQFTSLQQTRDLNKNFTTFTKQQSMLSATQFLGKLVTLNTPSGEVSGRVSNVTLDNDSPKIIVNGTAYATDAVIDVALPTSNAQ
jgi:flagellar basal-body rod modification protein FlgD